MLSRYTLDRGCAARPRLGVHRLPASPLQTQINSAISLILVAAQIFVFSLSDCCCTTRVTPFYVYSLSSRLRYFFSVEAGRRGRLFEIAWGLRERIYKLFDYYYLIWLYVFSVIIKKFSFIFREEYLFLHMKRF